MKKVCIKNRKINMFFIILSACFFLFNSCGLEEFIVVTPPTYVGNSPAYTNEDFSLNYVSFTTSEKDNEELGDSFKGTAVYYKIYNNTSDLTAEYENLQSLSLSENSKASASTQMIEIYGYKPLHRTDEDGFEYNEEVLIPTVNGMNRTVEIRLTNYQDDEKYKAAIIINKEDTENSVCYTPLRFENSYTFDFGRKGEKDVVPTVSETDVASQLDVKINATPTEPGKWYVALFAVGVAMNVSCVYNYSNILYLGTIVIDDKSEDN